MALITHLYMDHLRVLGNLDYMYILTSHWLLQQFRYSLDTLNIRSQYFYMYSWGKLKLVKDTQVNGGLYAANTV